MGPSEWLLDMKTRERESRIGGHAGPVDMKG